MATLKGLLRTKNILAFYTFLIMGIIYVPLVLMIFFSLKSGMGMGFPFEGFSTQWYMALFDNKTLVGAFSRSIFLGIIMAFATLIMTLCSALGLRHDFPGRDAIFYMLMLGFIIPGVVYGLGGLILYKQILGIKILTIWHVVPIQLIWTLPWGLILCLMRFDPYLAEQEAVARSLGAHEFVVFREITFPYIKLFVLASAALGFTLSFSELLRTSFVMGGQATLPVYVYSLIAGMYLTPEYYALGTITMCVSFILILLLALMMRRAGAEFKIKTA